MIQLEPPRTARDAPSPRGPAIWALGFRPFFLLAALHGVTFMPLWLLAYAGGFNPGAYLGGWAWHAHEMVFGFTLAVLSGFLLTAASNWTGRVTARGGLLALLAGVWLAGRAAMLASGLLPELLIALVNLAFLPLLVWCVGRRLVAARSRRNYGLLALLLALFGAQLMTHLGALGQAGDWWRRGSLVGVDLILLVVIVITGRIVPLFTRNATGVEGIRGYRWLDGATLVGMAGVTLLDIFGTEVAFAGWLAGLTGVLALGRAVRWGAQHTLGRPILWVLHAGHAFLPIGLWLRFADAMSTTVTPMMATHALTVGVIGLLTLGMMARVALGHTGRPLAVARPVVLAFWAMALAALVRVALPLVVPEGYRVSVLLSGSLWTLAFALYLAVYAPILWRPRVDGKPG